MDRADHTSKYLEKAMGNAEKNIRDQRLLNEFPMSHTGICVQCDMPIPSERLVVLPAAEFCISCQEDLESREKRFAR